MSIIIYPHKNPGRVVVTIFIEVLETHQIWYLLKNTNLIICDIIAIQPRSVRIHSLYLFFSIYLAQFLLDRRHRDTDLLISAKQLFPSVGGGTGSSIKAHKNKLFTGFDSK